MELRFSEDSELSSGTVSRSVRRCGLDEIARHEVVRVVGLEAQASPRLAALGFCPGTTVRLDRRAPLGDPMIFDLRGTRLALRACDARRIQVELVSI